MALTMTNTLQSSPEVRFNSDSPARDSVEQVSQQSLHTITTTNPTQDPVKEVLRQVVDLNITKTHQPQLSKTTKINAATTVFNIPELSEMILLNASHHDLRTTLPRVNKAIHQTILGSPKLQRYLHQAPLWTHPKMCPAPLPPTMATYTAHKDGSYDYANAPAIEANSRVLINIRFDQDALAWAAGPDRSTNASFRNMLICQPPVVAVELICWSTVNYRPRCQQGRVENEDGVTCGQLFDLVKAASPIGGNAGLVWVFSDASRRKGQ